MVSLNAGTTVRTPEGYSVFVPSPLPPSISWNDPLLARLSDADRAVGRLAGRARSSVPGASLALRPFLCREAVLSSKIEGTRVTVGELLAAEAGASVDRSGDELREVADYVVALEYGIERLKKLPLSLRLVRELHEKLMQGARGRHSTPGEFRRSQNWIGVAGSTLATATYVPPPPAEMMTALGHWESYLHDGSKPPLLQIALAHSQFEAIHPFLDGNGRVGRLLISLFLVERKILPMPVLSLSAFFEATRQEYYERLLGVTRSGDWERWLDYFFTGVARQAEDVLSRVERISGLLDRWSDEVGGSRNRSIDVIRLLAETPFWTVTSVADRLRVAFTTAQRAMEALRSAGIVEPTSTAKRDRVFCAREILAILEEPAAVRPPRAR